MQLAELIGFGYLSMIFYVFFKACEHVLVRHLTCEPQGNRTVLRDITESSAHSL